MEEAQREMQPQPAPAKVRRVEALGDFTTTPRLIPISILAVLIGLIASGVAWALLRLIGLVTNIFYYQRFSTGFASPAGNQLGFYALAVPIIGSLIVGIMARFGSERIRGHGIPEAIEAILMNGSRVRPRLAILKPLSAAIAIGSGGPFGAEGPIIMTGGAFGSLIAQFFHLTSAERKTLLVAGSAAGMSAVFATPVAAVTLAVELLLFEWKPRSLVPVALASATAGAARRYILGLGPLFPVPEHALVVGVSGLLSCVLVGLAAGLLAVLLTQGVYAAEDAFHKLPIHWMWWPAIGGLFVGLGGLIFPQALGVGYDTIGHLLQGNVAVTVIAGVLLVKSAIWIISLGSGTSGGVVAPILMMGAALGGIEATFLPNLGPGAWQLISMGAVLAGTMRTPFTGVIFATELTHDFNMLLPLLIACVAAHGLTVLTMKRSILTEKIARRGYHLSREYAMDPLEILLVREVMRTNVVALPATATLEHAAELIRPTPRNRGQQLFPIVDENRRLLGVISRNHLQNILEEPHNRGSHQRLVDVMAPDPIVAYSNEPLRVVAQRMVESGFNRFPVVDPSDETRLLGMVSWDELFRARSRNWEEERVRERVLRLRLPIGSGEHERITKEEVENTTDLPV
jgi:CIC family chloride channel protein